MGAGGSQTSGGQAMRIDDRYLNSSQAAQPGKTPASQEIDRQGDLRQAEARWGPGADRVELSELTGGLARLMASAAQERAERVERLRQDYEAGRYRVEIPALSRKIAAEMRASAAQAQAKPSA